MVVLVRLLIVVLIVLGGLATEAEAGWRIDRAKAIARVVWHHPCVDRMELRFKRPTNPLLSAADGWVQGGCVVYFNPELTTLWTRVCTVVLHEAGHLADFHDRLNPDEPWHSHDPRSIMYGENDRDYGIHSETGVEAGGDRRCRDRGRPYLERHELLEPK